MSPVGTRIPRWYCRQGHCTFSLLADCFAARFTGTLAEIETVVDEVDNARTFERAADTLRPDIELPGALRWVRRRAKSIHAVLTILKGLMPEYFLECELTLASFRRHLDVDPVLPVLRHIACESLALMPPPIGFSPPHQRGGESKSAYQHQMGPDPPWKPA